MKRVGIVGLGLIGGSIALGVRRQFPNCEIIGADRGTGSWPPGLLSSFFPLTADSDLGVHMPECDLVVLAVPVTAVLALIGPALRTGSVVTDVGSTKQHIAAAAAAAEGGERFVPGHPMTGAAGNGFALASADLFLRSTWFLCTENAGPSAVEVARGFVEALGAVPTVLTSDQHDQAVALTSHLPQLLASALCVLAHESRFAVAAGPAFERMTRGAGGSPEMWLDVFGTNAEHVAGQTERLARQLIELAAALKRRPPDLTRISELLDAARRAKDGADAGEVL